MGVHHERGAGAGHAARAGVNAQPGRFPYPMLVVRRFGLLVCAAAEPLRRQRSNSIFGFIEGVIGKVMALVQ